MCEENGLFRDLEPLLLGFRFEKTHARAEEPSSFSPTSPQRTERSRLANVNAKEVQKKRNKADLDAKSRKLRNTSAKAALTDNDGV